MKYVVLLVLTMPGLTHAMHTDSQNQLGEELASLAQQSELQSMQTIIHAHQQTKNRFDQQPTDVQKKEKEALESVKQVIAIEASYIALQNVINS